MLYFGKPSFLYEEILLCVYHILDTSCWLKVSVLYTKIISVLPVTICILYMNIELWKELKKIFTNVSLILAYVFTVIPNQSESSIKFVLFTHFFLPFSIPPLAVVGLSEEEAVEKATGDILVFTSGFNPMKNTISGYASI